jgi:hypothetical protein
MNVSFESTTPENPKVLNVSDRAFRLWFNATCYCRRNSTDGQVPALIVTTLCPSSNRKTVNELVEAGLLEQYDARTFVVHDYLDHNPSRADVERVAKREQDERDATRDRTRRWRDGRRDASQPPQSDASHFRHGDVSVTSMTKREVQPKESYRATETTLLVVDRFSEHVTRHDEHAEPNARSETWLREARLLVESDKRPVDQILAVIEWLGTSSSDASFWRTVVLSVPKLRQKFPQLVAKMAADGAPGRRENASDWLREIDGGMA